MLKRARLRLVALVVIAFIAAAIGACSLNPQPIPPGSDSYDNNENGTTVGAPSDASMAVDSGAKTSDAATQTPADAEADAPPVTAPEDGGDRDADASNDAGSDASDADAAD